MTSVGDQAPVQYLPPVLPAAPAYDATPAQVQEFFHDYFQSLSEFLGLNYAGVSDFAAKAKGLDGHALYLLSREEL